MRFFIFITAIIVSVFLSAQQNKPLQIRIVDSSTHRVLATVRNVNHVRVEMLDGSVYKGHIKINSDSDLIIKGQVIRPEMIKYIYNSAPILVAASTIVLYPLSLIITPGLLIWVVSDTPGKYRPYYVVISNKTKDEIEIAGIKEHMKRDSLYLISHADSNFESTLRVNKYRIERKENCLHAPSDFIFVGTDLEKLVVPGFSVNAEYFFKPYFGLFAQFGYKPMNPDGTVFYMTNRTQPYYFCEHYMLRFSPLLTFGNKPERHSFFFAGPTLFYKTMNADQVNFCLYNNGDGDDRYVTYWYNETIKGVGLRMGFIPKNLAGIGLSFEVSYRTSKNHSYYPETWWNNFTHEPYVINNHNYSIKQYTCFDASVTWRLRIRKNGSTSFCVKPALKMMLHSCARCCFMRKLTL